MRGETFEDIIIHFNNLHINFTILSCEKFKIQFINFNAVISFSNIFYIISKSMY